MALFLDIPKGRIAKVCPGCDMSYYDVCPRCNKKVTVVRDHNPPVIAMVVNSNPWLVETFGPFDDLDAAQEWALKVMKQWWPDNTYEWNEELTQYEDVDALSYGDYGSGIKIDVLEHPVDGR